MTIKHAANSPPTHPGSPWHLHSRIRAHSRVTLTSSGITKNTGLMTAGHDWKIICSWSNFIRKLILSQWHWSSSSQVIWINGCREQLVSTPCELQSQPPCFPIIHWWTTAPLSLSLPPPRLRLCVSPKTPLEIFDLNTIDFGGHTYRKTLTLLYLACVCVCVYEWAGWGIARR